MYRNVVIVIDNHVMRGKLQPTHKAAIDRLKNTSRQEDLLQKIDSVCTDTTTACAEALN